MQCKFLIIGFDKETKEYLYPDIVYSDSDVDDYNQKDWFDKVIHDCCDLAIRAYNHEKRDQGVKGLLVAIFGNESKFFPGDRKTISKTYNGFTLEEAQKIYSQCWDSGIGGFLGNIDAKWTLSDIALTDEFWSVDECLPEDVCLCIYGRGEKGSWTKDCICKFDDGTMKFAHRKTINSEDEKFEWIEEYSKRKLKNAKSYTDFKNGKSFGYEVMPAYHWVMPKEWADRVVSWRWFKEGETREQYM